MYKKSFYITKPVGNNAFSFNKRSNKKIYVPSLKQISNFDEIKLQNDKKKIAFEEFDINGNLQSCFGLKNFYSIDWTYPVISKLNSGNHKKSKKIFLFDNHNHAFYFWYLARKKNLIGKNNTLFHIDEHSDMRDPGVYLKDTEVLDLKKIFEFTNFKLNVGNYIIPAQKQELVGEVIQVRSEEGLLKSEKLIDDISSENIILNLDLDFFRPELDFIDYDLKKKIILKIARKAKLITIATSPFFIKQDLAIEVFRDLFSTST